jgi:hypothetical protein
LEKINEPDVYCESGLVYLWGAIQYFVFVRNIKSKSIYQYSEHTIKHYETRIIGLLNKSQIFFEHGIVVSPSGADNRCAYWLVYAKAILQFIENDPDLIRTKKTLIDEKKVFYQAGNDVFTLIGWKDERFGEEYFFRRFWESIRKYQNAVLNRSYEPNVFYSIATIVFDFSPVLKVSILKMVILWLQTSKQLVMDLDQTHATLYVTSCFSKIMPIPDFIKSIDAALKFIEETASEFLSKDDDVEINMDIFNGTKLLLMNFDGNDNAFIKIPNS